MTRERILVIGGPGSGKTYGWLKLANHLRQSHFYVIDTELSAEGSLEEFPNVNSVTIYPAVDWPEYREAQKEAIKNARPGDWIVVDMADKAWNASQRHFISEIFDEEMGQYFLEARRKLKKDAKSLFAGRDAALKGWTDWPVINRLYDDFIFPLLYRAKAHLYMASAVTAVSEDDEREVRELYGPYGLKPAGQKSLAHQPDTVLLLAHTRNGYHVTTIKDRRGRQYMERQEFKDFYVQYGLKIARWRAKVAEKER